MFRLRMVMSMPLVLVACTANDPSGEMGTTHANAIVTLTPPESVSQQALSQAGFLKDAKLGGEVRNLIVLEFRHEATLAQRRAAIDSVVGEVIGGVRTEGDSTDGAYYVRVRPGTAEGLLRAQVVLMRQPGVARAGLWGNNVGKWFTPVRGNPQ